MIFSKEEIEKVKAIFEKAYKELEAYHDSPEHRDIPEGSMLDTVYDHIYSSEDPIKTIRESQKRRSDSKPGKSKSIEVSKEHLNSMLKQLLENQKTNTISRVEGIFREANLGSKHSKAPKKQFLNQVIDNLKDYGKEANRNWNRIVTTETSNAIGLASVDRIVAQNEGKDLTEIYCYRIPVIDGATCKWCKKFYIDSDGTPAVYSLAELIANNTNYGKKTDEWKPVAGAVHPFDRCSPTIELKPGFKVVQGGSQTFIGLKAWNDYIKTKLR